MLKKLIKYGTAAILITITVWILLSQLGTYDMDYLLSRTNKSFIMLSALSMVGYWLTDAAAIKYISNNINIKYKYTRSLKLTLIGQYYTAITPFSLGCQPAQIYKMMSDSISAGAATSIIVDKFIIYQVIISFYTGILLIMKYSFVQNTAKALFPIIQLGMILRFIGAFLIIGLFLYPNFLKKVMLFIITLANRLKIIKNIEGIHTKLLLYFDEYTEGVKRIKGNWKASLYTSLITLIQIVFYLSVTYFIYIGLGYNKASYFDITAIQGILYMTISFIPTPGTAGAAEGGFYLLFAGIFDVNMIVYATLLWRIISYYFNLVICGLVVLVDYFEYNRKKLALKKT